MRLGLATRLTFLSARRIRTSSRGRSEPIESSSRETFATLTKAEINSRKWLTWFLESCAQNGGQVPEDITPFLPWQMSQEKRREMTLDPDDSS